MDEDNLYKDLADATLFSLPLTPAIQHIWKPPISKSARLLLEVKLHACYCNPPMLTFNP